MDPNNELQAFPTPHLIEASTDPGSCGTTNGSFEVLWYLTRLRDNLFDGDWVATFEIYPV